MTGSLLWDRVIEIVVAIVAVFCTWAYLSFDTRLEQDGIRVLGTIKKMHSMGDQDQEVEMTVQWTNPAGNVFTKTFLHPCDFADLPRVGDAIEIIAQPDYPQAAERTDKRMLRRDPLPAQSATQPSGRGDA